MEPLAASSPLALVLGLGLLSLAGCTPAREDAAGHPASAAVAPVPPPSPTMRGVLLEDLTWMEAEKVLTPDRIVVIPLGAASKEHGPHLLLKNDWTLAEYFKRRVAEKADVAIAPTVNYSYYPAFVEYPGSVSLRLEIATGLIVDVCRSLARFGPRRFYVLNTGVSTVKALAPAREQLAADGIVLAYTNLIAAIGSVEKEVAQQAGGTHADEIETSMMLVIDPAHVDMKKAVKDYNPGTGPLCRDPACGDGGTYSPTGSWGDPTLATREKGEKVVEALVSALVKDLQDLASLPVPPRP